MPKRTRVVIGGVDTHGRTHHAAAIDQLGRLLADAEFPADTAATANCWAGCVATGSSLGRGRGHRQLRRRPNPVPARPRRERLEVDRPNRRTRRQRGKSRPDRRRGRRPRGAGRHRHRAAQARRDRGGDPGAAGGARGAVKARTAAINQLKVWWSPPRPRCASRWTGAPPPRLVAACARLRPDPTPLADPAQATKAALRSSRRASWSWTRRSRSPTIGWPPRPPAAPRRWAAGDRRRPRRAAAGHHRRQPRAAPQRGRLRAPVRRRADPGLLGQDPPAPAPPRR